MAPAISETVINQMAPTISETVINQMAPTISEDGHKPNGPHN